MKFFLLSLVVISFPFSVFANACKGSFSFNKGPAFELFQQAIQARDNAYAPYSNFYVGSALLTTNGKTYCGCNVENVSFRATQCAEANAVANMISGGEKEIKELVLVIKSGEQDGKELIGTPCGICRQIISEFASSDTPIHVYTPTEGYKKSYTMKELLPGAFQADNLK